MEKIVFLGNAKFLSDQVKIQKIIKKLMDKKAKDIVIIDLRNFNHITDFFIICTCESSNHRKAVIESLEEEMKNLNISILFSDFNPLSQWNVLDLDDVIVHVFEEEARRFYDIEGLWSDAPQIKISENL
ncbi:Ribosomal silencing factor RsfS [bacterium HR19]|nr:Ribosomal silencing factor RsfS [bacterium HR19]